MNLPAYGITARVWLVRVIDADTIIVRLDPTTSRELPPVRLLDCWAPEITGREKPLGLAAKRFAEELLEGVDTLSLHVPDHVLRDPHTGAVDVLGALGTFKRLLAHVFIDSQTTLAERLIAAGHAFPTKDALAAHVQAALPEHA